MTAPPPSADLDARFSWSQDVGAQLVAIGLLGAIRAGTLVTPVPVALRTTRRLARLVLRHRGAQPPSRRNAHARSVALITRASWIVPGASCVHRALAGRLWLAWHGHEALVVLGVRKRDALEGHAWLELPGPAPRGALFLSPSDRYVPILDEARARDEAGGAWPGARGLGDLRWGTP